MNFQIQVTGFAAGLAGLAHTCQSNALAGADGNLRAHAAEGLGRAGDKRAAGPLIAALKDDKSQVRTTAAKALAALKDPRGRSSRSSHQTKVRASRPSAGSVEAEGWAH